MVTLTQYVRCDVVGHLAESSHNVDDTEHGPVDGGGLNQRRDCL